MKNLTSFFGLLLALVSYGQPIAKTVAFSGSDYEFGRKHHTVLQNPTPMSPLELVTYVFTDYDFITDIPQYSTGSYDGKPNVSDINRAYDLSFKVLAQNEKTAVVNMTLDSMGQGKDIYVYLQKQGNWKIESIKALPVNYQQQEEWKLLQERKAEIDRLKLSDSNYQAPVEFEREYALASRWFALDDQIIDYFKTNELEFENLLQEIKNEQKEGTKQLNSHKQLSSDYKNLVISSISNADYCINCYDFSIGEFVYSSLGYLYIPDPKAVPKMNSETDIIVIKAMGNGWYFYKIT